MAKIGEKTINEMVGQVEGLTRAWLFNLNDAFKKFGGEKFPIAFKVVLNAGRAGCNDIKTEIKFRPEPDVSDTTNGSADEDQMGLFEIKAAPDKRGQVGNPPRFKAIGG